MGDWQKAFAGQPAFAHLKPWLDGFAAADWPELDTLNHLATRQNLRNANGLPVRFAPQSRHCGQHEYEIGIHASGQVPSRERNWHDLFNALIWLAFPATKATLNAVHQTTLRLGNNRLPASDAATLFDESGLVLVGEDGVLAELLAARHWRAALVDHRARWARVSVYIVGHAVLEKLVHPWPGITAKCLFIDLPADSAMTAVDAAIARSWRDGAASLFPLPVLGIPGWWPANEDSGFYDDRRFFRPPR